MKTYEVTIRVKGVKRTFRTIAVHAENKKNAVRVAITAFAENEPNEYRKGCGNYTGEAKQIA